MAIRLGTDGDDVLLTTGTDIASEIDYIYGLDGNDTLNGLAGQDYLYGGRGDDTYIVQDDYDSVNEGRKEGNDTIISSLSLYNLPAYVENLVLAEDSGNSIGIGNSMNNIMTGNSHANELYGVSGNDILNGGNGHDILGGGSGRDIFQLTSADALTVPDDIIDFKARDDTIQLENAIFTALGTTTGTINPNQFTTGYVSADTRIIYGDEVGDGGLYYDPDGNGAAESVLIAQLVDRLNITYADFVII